MTFTARRLLEKWLEGRTFLKQRSSFEGDTEQAGALKSKAQLMKKRTSPDLSVVSFVLHWCGTLDFIVFWCFKDFYTDLVPRCFSLHCFSFDSAGVFSFTLDYVSILSSSFFSGVLSYVSCLPVSVPVLY